MKRYIISETLLESDVHPENLYGDYRRASIEYSKALAAESHAFIDVDCPFCKKSIKKAAFSKESFDYQECMACSSLFVSPRPSAEAIKSYLLESQASKLRHGSEYVSAILDRIQTLSEQRAEFVESHLAHLKLPKKIADVHTRYTNVMDVFEKYGFDMTAVEPFFVNESYCDKVRSFETLGAPIYSAVCAESVLEHVQDLDLFFEGVERLLIPKGIFVATMRASSGLDIQALWQESDILPLEHLNLASVEGIKDLLSQKGFKLIEISTPGQLDLKKIENFINQNPDAKVPRFLKYFMKNRNELAKEKLQHFIQETQMSSHLRVVAQKVK